MRNAFVVLVSLCIGLVCGFIVPSSVPEQSTIKNNISYGDTSMDMKAKSTMRPKYAELPGSRSNIDEKDLYEHATEKKNNQSERAFIYINLKFNRNNFRNKPTNMLPIDRTQFPNTHVTAPVAQASDAQTPCLGAFDTATNFNSKFLGFNIADSKQRPGLPTYFSDPDLYMFKRKFTDESKKKELLKSTMQTPISQTVDGRRDYFELLKTPLLRPLSHNVNYETIQKTGLPSLSTSRIPYSKSYIKKYSLKNTFVPHAKTSAVPLQDEIRTNYGFKGAFIQRPAYQTMEQTNRIEDANFENEFLNDDFSRNFENNQDEDKLFDKYLKDTLEEEPLINFNDKMRVNDCMQYCNSVPHKKRSKNNGILIIPDCQCGKKTNAKLANPLISKDRSLRQESDRNVTHSQSSEVVFYEEDVVSSESSLLKHGDAVIKPTKIINQTSFV